MCARKVEKEYLMKDITYPNSIESEKAVLGGLLCSKAIRNEIVASLNDEDFYAPPNQTSPNRLIYHAIVKLMNNGGIVDIPSVTAELSVNMKALDEVGGMDYVRNLMEEYIGDTNAKYHCGVVRDLALSRRLINCMTDCVIGFSSKERKIDDIGLYVAECGKRIIDITQARRVSEFENVGDIVTQITDELKISKDKKVKASKGISTGYRLMDTYTQRWRPGQFNILAARPSVGKTAFALNLAYNAANESGKVVLFFSLEMDSRSIVNRLLACVSSVCTNILNTGNLNDEEWLQLDSAVSALKNTKLLIDDTAGQKLADIKTKVNKCRAQYGDDLGAVFIDYLGLITMSTPYDSRQQEVSEISRQLKALARECEVPIICLSQLSRANEQRKSEERKPKLSDLRDSGSIEQDADMVLFIYRDDYQNAKESQDLNALDPMDRDPYNQTSTTKISIAKNRNGQVGDLTYTFFKKIGKFVELDTSADAPEGR
jgi:replicative DNA helicase